MNASIFQFISSQAIASYFETIASNDIPYLGEALFPSDKKRGLKLSWIKGKDDLPVSLMPSEFDARPLLRDRGGVSTESTQMPFFRESMRIGEEDRQNLMMFAQANQGNAYAQEIMKRIFDDAANLIKGATLNPEIMRMGIITEGKFSINSPSDSGQTAGWTYNYDPSNEWDTANNTTLLAGDRWSEHDTSNPIRDIQEIYRAARRRGITLSRMIIGYDTWLDLLNNKIIKNAINPQPGVAENKINTDDQVKAFIESMTKVKITVYDKIYKDTSRQERYFYPNHGFATFIPATALGKTWYGTTPEEADLMVPNSPADVSIVNNGITVSTQMEALPVNKIVWVSEIVLPSFENMDRVFNVKYDATTP